MLMRGGATMMKQFYCNEMLSPAMFTLHELHFILINSVPLFVLWKGLIVFLSTALLVGICFVLCYTKLSLLSLKLNISSYFVIIILKRVQTLRAIPCLIFIYESHPRSFLILKISYIRLFYPISNNYALQSQHH